MNLLSAMRYLVALNEHQHFGRAAQACHITQPALSNALRALEAEFDVAIVKRDRSYAGLTPEGERVLATAQFMLREHAHLKQQIKGDAQVPRGPICLGAVPTAMPIAARFAAMLQARHPALRPTVLSLSSADLEKRLNDLSVDLALGYTDRMAGTGVGTGVVTRPGRLHAWPQYTEHYFLLRRCTQVPGSSLRVGPKMRWKDAAALSLCLLTPDMHNRKLIDAAFTAAGATVQATIETNSILTLALSVVAGEVSAIMPGALIGTVRGYGELEALPLVSPEILTPIGFMSNAGVRPSLALEAALTLAQDGAWLRHAAAHSGLLVA